MSIIHGMVKIEDLHIGLKRGDILNDPPLVFNNNMCIVALKNTTDTSAYGTILVSASGGRSVRVEELRFYRLPQFYRCIHFMRGARCGECGGCETEGIEIYSPHGVGLFECNACGEDFHFDYMSAAYAREMADSVEVYKMFPRWRWYR